MLPMFEAEQLSDLPLRTLAEAHARASYDFVLRAEVPLSANFVVVVKHLEKKGDCCWLEWRECNASGQPSTVQLRTSGSRSDEGVRQSRPGRNRSYFRNNLF